MPRGQLCVEILPVENVIFVVVNFSFKKCKTLSCRFLFWMNLEAKLKFCALKFFSVENSQLLVEKLQFLVSSPLRSIDRSETNRHSSRLYDTA